MNFLSNMMKNELTTSKLSRSNLGSAMIGSNTFPLKNGEEEEYDDGDSFSSKLDLHFSKDEVVDDDYDFENFSNLKPADQHHVSMPRKEAEEEEGMSNGKLSSISHEIKATNTCMGSGDMIYSLLSILGTHNKDDMSKTLYAMSTSPESCVAMRQSGCLPLLIHLLHNSENDPNYFNVRHRSAISLRNIVNVHCEDQRGRQESRVLRLLEQLRDYCDHLRASMLYNNCSTDQNYFKGLLVDVQHPVGAVTALMKLTFDEEHRHAVCTLGGIQALAELLQLQQEVYGHSLDPDHITMRRYTCMALTNLTFGDGTNKALLCSMPSPLRSLVLQLQSVNEDLCQVAASVLRNLSWHADAASKRNLRAAGAVQMLTQTMLAVKKEPTLKSLLSALWNFSAHCPENKEDICTIQGALQLLVWSLNFKSPSKTLAVIENGGGVLRNVSSHVAVRPDYRVILRKHGCLPTLLKHLRSPSLTVVSNACGTLWNLSAHCLEDQKILCGLGATEMLKNLVHSKHRMISMGSASALKNLLSSSAFTSLNGIMYNPYSSLTSSWMCKNDANFSFNSADRPGLHVRRQRALQRELQSRCLSETYDNTSSPLGSPVVSPQSFDFTHPFSRSLQNKASVNFTPSKPPPYPIHFSDVICHSDTDALNKAKSLLNPVNQNQLANLSLEHQRLDELFGLEDNFYSPGMFLSCHETITTGGQDTAADFLPCSSQNDDEDRVTCDLEWPKTFYSGEIVNPNYFRDVGIIENTPTVQDLEEEMIRVTVNNDGEIVDLSQLSTGQDGGLSMPMLQNQLHLTHHLLSNSNNMYGIQKIQGNNILNHPLAFDELPSTEQIFNSNNPRIFDNDLSSFHCSPDAEPAIEWGKCPVRNKRDIPEVIKDKKNTPCFPYSPNSPKKAKKSFLKQPTNYNLSRFDESIKNIRHCEDDDDEVENSYDEQHIGHFQSDLMCVTEDLAEYNYLIENNYEAELESSTSFSQPDQNLSLEHELALQENAKLVLSVLERTSLTESNLSSDVHLLENETISLISDNETTDDMPFGNNLNSNSTECCLKNIDSQKTTVAEQIVIVSRGNSEDDIPSISNDEELFAKGRPRIVKPISATKPPNRVDDKDSANEPRGIRGRRKALYPAKAKASVVSTDKRIISPSPSRSTQNNLPKDDKRTKTATVSNICVKNQTQPKVSNNLSKDKVSKVKEDKKVIKNVSIPRPQSAFIRNPGSSSTSTEEVIRQAKLKSHSLPPGQKPPILKDYQGVAQHKLKPKILSKQDTFVKPSKPNMNTSNDNLQKQEQKQPVKPSIKGKSKKIPSKLQSSGTSGELTVVPNEKVTPASSTYAKHGNPSSMSKSGSINSISSSKCSTSALKVSSKSSSAVKTGLKKSMATTAEEMATRLPATGSEPGKKYEDNSVKQEHTINRLQKSSTYDKLKEFFGDKTEDRSDNVSNDSGMKNSRIESDSLEKACKEKSHNPDNRSLPEVLPKTRVSKIPNISKKQSAETRTSPGKKEPTNKVLYNSIPEARMKESFSDRKKLTESDLKKENNLKEIVILDSTLIKNKPLSAPPNKSKLTLDTSSRNIQREVSAMNAKNLSKTLPLDNSTKIQFNGADSQLKNKHRPNRGFSFWKKHPGKGKEETQDQSKVTSTVANSTSSAKKTTNKNKVSPKAESPIRKKVLGWFKKGSETHTVIAEKNKCLAEKSDLSDFNFNKGLIPTDMGRINEFQNAETFISTLDARNGNSSPIRAAVVLPFNYQNLDCMPISLPDSPSIHTPPKFTKTELLLARHRRSRLASDSRSSMAMSIDSLKVNSVDSFQHTDRSFSDVPSEITEKDDISIGLSENSPITVSS